MPKISIIVAVYNEEKYLRQCLDSLIHQSLKDIEIICIDDASEDSSPDILQEYASKDSRIHLLKNEKNIGQAKSRNRGIDIATGEYICYLDGDDWFNLDSLQIILSTFAIHPEADCVLFNLVKKTTQEPTQNLEDTSNSLPLKEEFGAGIFSGQEAFLLSIDWRLHGVYAAKNWLFKTYPYDTSTRYYSDDNTTRIHYLHSNKVVCSNAVYNYRQHKEAGTTKISIHTFDHILANLSLKDQLIKEKVSKEALSTLEIYRLYNLLGAYKNYFLYQNSFTQEEKQEIHSRMRKVLSTIDTTIIPSEIKYRFGYYPFKNYTFFCLQQNIFWFLRRLLGKK